MRRGRVVDDPVKAKLSAGAVNRLNVLAVVLFLGGAGIFVKLVSLQVIQHEKYQNIAKSQQEEKVVLTAPRGSIYDRNGQPLALSVPAESVSVDPRQISDPRVATEMLGNILHLDQTVLYQRLQQAKDNHKGFMWVKRHLDPFETARLKAVHLDYVTFNTESVRHYPGGEVAAHVLGDVNRDEEGAAGIELALDKQLKGKAGQERLVVDVKRRGIDSHVDSAPLAGTALTLTIDERLQYVAETALKAGVEAKHARSGTAIVMNPYTGEILALANYPTYNPNRPPVAGDDPLSRFDLGVSVPFEPGSIFKVVTLSAALETTNLTPDSPIPTGGGTLVLPGRVIHESHHGFGTISMAEVLAYSSNIGAILIGQRVGRENMYEYARRLGFGEKTGVGLPAESRGILRPLNRWGTTSLASISMGQEVSTTSVQLARLCAVIANGGMLVRPKIVLKRGDKPEPAEPPVRVLKPDTVMKMRMMMEGVVLNPRGTAHRTARLNGYTSAGKTGTAQIFDSATHHYTHFYNASFMGFTPVTNPRLAIVVTINHTEGDGGMGASAAGPAFNTIATEALRMMDVPKDIPEEITDAKPEKNVKPYQEDVSIAGLGETSVMDEDDSLKRLIAEQSKPAAADDEIPAAPAIAGQKPAGKPEGLTPQALGPTVPDFRGKSMRAVVETASADGIAVMLEGSGVARAQVPLPGTPLRPGEKIRIVFAR
ncbi:MAG: transpeptidase family protein [Acidobacteriota bacterium]|nr:transpeptidase family protein [Acidobacteriota bacterium]